MLYPVDGSTELLDIDGVIAYDAIMTGSLYMDGDIISNPGFVSGADIGVEPYKFLGVLGTDTPHCNRGKTEILLSSIDALCDRALELSDAIGTDILTPHRLWGDGVEVCSTSVLETIASHLS